MRRSSLIVPCTLAVGMTVAPLHAGSLHSGDIIVSVSKGALVTGGAVSGGGFEPRRVFDSDLELFFGVPFSDDPGFDSQAGALPAFSVVRLNMLDALRRWDGEDFDEVWPAPMRIRFGQTSFDSPATPDTSVQGPGFAVSQFGEIHVHPLHELRTAPGSGEVFLLKFELTNSGGVAPSEPFYFVYNFDEPESVQAEAIAWVEQNLLGGDPTPDINGDGVVDGVDLAFLLGAWGACDGCPEDLNGDGAVDGIDLAFLLGGWGPA